MKKTLLPLSLLGASLLLTSCASGTDMTTATNSPAPTGTTAPIATVAPTGMMPGMNDFIDNATDAIDDMVTGQPDATAMPESTGVTSMDKARRAIESIEDELERLSEVDDAQVVIAGNKAAVALEFDDQYRGGIDDRLRGIVKERIDSVISGISTVAITSDSDIMDALETLGDRLDATSDMNALKSDLDAIIRKINGQA